MKKIFVFAVLVAMSLSATVAFAQERRNIQTDPSSSVSKFQVETKRFMLNIEIEIDDDVCLDEVKIKPNENHERMYLNGNWGTIDKHITFNRDIKKNIVAFVVAYRVVQVGDVLKLHEEGVPCNQLENFVSKNIFKDVMTKKILVIAEFKNSLGETVKKDLEINFDKNSAPSGGDIFAKAKISSSDLGLNVITYKVNTQKVFFRFSLENKEYGIKLVVDPNGKTTEFSTLARGAVPDGIYPFVCRLELPNGIQKEQKIEAFVVNNEIFINNASFNSLVFANGDYGKATFKGKISLAKFRNTRSSPVVLFVPNEYVVKRSVFTTGESEISTEPFVENGAGWTSYVIPAGSTVKIKVRVSVFPVVVYDLNRKTSDIVTLGMANKNFQTIDIKWGDKFSLNTR